MGGDRVALARESIYEGNKRIVTIEGVIVRGQPAKRERERGERSWLRER